MENNLVLKHHKDFHRVQFQGLSINQRNLVFALCCKVMNQDDNLLIFNISEMSSLSKLKKRKMSNKETFQYLEELYNTLKKTSIKIKKENGVKIFTLFTDYESFEDKGTFQIRVNSSFRYMLNDIKEPFSLQNLKEYTNLKSGYSQLLYSFLKEWEKKKEYIFTMEEFREELGVPISYDIDTINKRVLSQVMKELPQYFFNLKLEKIKTGRKVTSLKFTWSKKQKEILDIKEAEIVELEISEQLNKAIEKAKKNRFIEKFLTLDNIEILTQMFQENDLVKGLLWAYKEVKQDISTLNYLIKTIRTGAEQKEIKIKVKKEAIQEVEQKILFDEKEEFSQVDNLDPIEKEKISPDKYEELYQKYLKENEIGHNKITRLGFDKSIGAKYEITKIPKEKIYTVNELPKEKLLSKSGKELKGVSLLMRLRKLAQDMKISIEYNSEIIKGV